MPELQPTELNFDTQEEVPALPKVIPSRNCSTHTAQVSTASIPVTDIIQKIGSADIATAIHAIKLAEDLCKESAPSVFEQINQLLTACCDQLTLIFTFHLSGKGPTPAKNVDLVRLCKHLLSCIMHVFNSRALAMAISAPVLKSLVGDLVTRLLDERLEQIGDGPQVVLSKHTACGCLSVHAGFSCPQHDFVENFGKLGSRRSVWGPSSDPDRVCDGFCCSSVYRADYEVPLEAYEDDSAMCPYAQPG